SENLPAVSLLGRSIALDVHRCADFWTRSVARASMRRLARREVDLGLDFERELAERLDELIGQIRLLQKAADFLGDRAIKAALRFVDLRKEVVRDLFGELELAHEMAQILGPFGDFADAALEDPFQDLR